MSDDIFFLFGAGASKGAGHILPCDPPLGVELYDKLLEHYPEVWGPGSHLARYSEALRQDFGKTMFNEVTLWDSSLSVLEWQRTMALYFSSFSPDSSANNLYTRLLSSLKDAGLLNLSLFTSLNYDCILEQAAYGLGLHVAYSSDEVGKSAVHVLKVHGSCNFITGNLRNSRQYLTNPNSSLECHMDCLPPTGVESVLRSKFSEARGDHHYPVMSVYGTGKNTPVAPVQIQQIRNRWSEYATHASIGVVIGVSPNSGDHHIWNAITSTPAELFYIGSKNDFDRWASANSNFNFIAETFERGFEELPRILSS